METPDLVYALGLPPRDAVAYLESKGVKATRNWYEVWQEAQAKSFTVAGMTQLERESLIPESGEGHMVRREEVVNPRAPEGQQVRREVWGWQEIFVTRGCSH